MNTFNFKNLISKVLNKSNLSFVLMLAVIFSVVTTNTAFAENEEAIQETANTTAINITQLPPQGCITLGTTVTISGTAIADAPPGKLEQYHVQINWGDGTTDDQVEESSFGTGKGIATRNFSKTHTFTSSSTQITARIYHVNPSGNDGNGESSQTIQVCIVTPPPTTGSLIVNKIVNGGTAATSSFSLFVDGSPVTSGVATTTSAGRHVVSETPTANYTGQFSGACDSQGNVTVSTSSESSVCILTNTYVTPPPTTGATINITKVTNPGNIDQDFVFTLTKGEGFLATTTANAEKGIASITGLKPGTYTLSEDQTPFWQSDSVVCDSDEDQDESFVRFGKRISVNGDDVVNCVFTNSTSVIKVVKNVVAPDGTTDVSDTHAFSVTLNGTSTKSIAEGSDALYYNIDSETLYTIAENSDSNYDLVSISPDMDESTPGAQIYAQMGTTTVVTIVNKQHSTPTPPQPTGDPMLNPNAPRGGGSSGPVLPIGQVLGASTDTGSTCGPLLSTYMRMGKKNDSGEVTKLQKFLNQIMGTNIPVDGVFGIKTDAAVRAFQLKYGSEILGPWVEARLHPNTNVPTGYVYKTTLRWINLLNCSNLNIPVPQLP